MSRVLLACLFLAASLHSYQLHQPGSLHVTVIDLTTGSTTPARVLLSDPEGQAVSAPEDALAMPGSTLGIPEEAVAVMYGRQDQAEGYARQPDGAFYTAGAFSMSLPAGQYVVEARKGYEFRPATAHLQIQAGQELTARIELRRWIDMPSRGWYSADDHIHLRRSPRDDPLILKWAAAEDIHVANILQMGDFWATYYSQYAFGERGRSREGTHILSSGQEDPRTPELGHTISLGAREFVRFPRDYYRYDRVFDEVHRLNGVSGYAHQGMSFHGYRGMTMDVSQNKLDFLELLQFCVEGGPLHLEHYYTFLDLGFRLTATAGSDFPWCGRGPRFGLTDGCSQIGDARFFTRVEGPLTFESWMQGVRAGHTFVSSGPMLEFLVNDALPGDTLEIPTGTTLRIRARAFGERDRIPLSSLEVVGHGKVLRSVHPGGPGDTEELALDFDWVPDHGIWLAARASAGKTQVAHTTPAYVTVDGGGFHNSSAVAGHVERLKGYLDEIEQALEAPPTAPDQQLYRHEASVRQRVSEVRRLLSRMEQELGSDSTR